MDPELQKLPFLTRKMLSFEYAVVFKLRVELQADTAAVVRLRGMTRENTFEFPVTSLADSTIKTATFEVSDIPIFVTLEDTNHDYVQGSCFATVSLLADGVVIQQLISGYIYAQKALSWPFTQQVDLRPGGGKLSTYTTADPAAGATEVINIPQGEIWKIQSLNINLTTDSTVANRILSFKFQFSNGTSILCPSEIYQTLSTSVYYVGAKYGADVASLDSSIRIIKIPTDIIMQYGDQISPTVTIAGTGDNRSAMLVSYEKYFTTP